MCAGSSVMVQAGAASSTSSNSNRSTSVAVRDHTEKFVPLSVGWAPSGLELPALHVGRVSSRGYQTSPSRQSQTSSAFGSMCTSTGSTKMEPSSSGVRIGPVGASTDVGPCQCSQPRGR